jgi:hypothetical protein
MLIASELTFSNPERDLTETILPTAVLFPYQVLAWSNYSLCRLRSIAAPSPLSTKLFRERMNANLAVLIVTFSGSLRSYQRLPLTRYAIKSCIARHISLFPTLQSMMSLFSWT